MKYSAILASLGAMAFVASSRDFNPLGLEPVDGEDALARRISEPDDAALYLSAPAPRPPSRTAGTSKYMPHQGAREMERRRKRLAAKA